MHVLQIDSATVFDEIHKVHVFGNVPRQQNGITGDLVPTRFENRILQDDLRCAEVVDGDFFIGDLQDLGDVKGAGGRVAYGDEFLLP
jgi:hypothetical protein